jgi:hypothetical protein
MTSGALPSWISLWCRRGLPTWATRTAVARNDSRSGSWSRDNHRLCNCLPRSGLSLVTVSNKALQKTGWAIRMMQWVPSYRSWPTCRGTTLRWVGMRHRNSTGRRTIGLRWWRTISLSWWRTISLWWRMIGLWWRMIGLWRRMIGLWRRMISLWWRMIGLGWWRTVSLRRRRTALRLSRRLVSALWWRTVSLRRWRTMLRLSRRLVVALRWRKLAIRLLSWWMLRLLSMWRLSWWMLRLLSMRRLRLGK